MQYQTGAPVSRAAFKARAREVSALHHATEVAHAVAVAAGKMEPVPAELFPAWDALGIVQHHDAMPGTMSTKVRFPLLYLLRKCLPILSKANSDHCLVTYLWSC
jgi:hypothetical protein